MLGSAYWTVKVQKPKYRSHRFYGLLSIPPGRLADTIRRIITRSTVETRHMQPPPPGAHRVRTSLKQRILSYLGLDLMLESLQDLCADLEAIRGFARTMQWVQNKRDKRVQALHDRFATLEKALQDVADSEKVLSPIREIEWRQKKRDRALEALHDRFCALERDMDDRLEHGRRLEALIIALGHSMALDLSASADADLNAPGATADPSPSGEFEIWDPHIGPEG